MTPTPTFAGLLALHEAAVTAGMVEADEAIYQAAEAAFRTALTAAFATPGEDEMADALRDLVRFIDGGVTTAEMLENEKKPGTSSVLARAREAIAAMSPRPSAKDSGGDAPRPEPSSTRSLAQGWQPRLRIAWHGTDDAGAEAILANGFKPYTYFAAALEDAVAFGKGQHIFEVAVEVALAPDEWQFKFAAVIPPRQIVRHYRLTTETLHDWPERRKAIFDANASTSPGPSRVHREAALRESQPTMPKTESP